MKRTPITYEGYRITAAPRRLEGSNNWTVDLIISRGSGEGEESWVISAGEQPELNEEALELCFSFGKELIDREMRGAD